MTELRKLYTHPQPWHTPVYLAQVFTTNIAKDLTGDHRNVTRGNIEDIIYQAPFCLRLRKPYRTAEVQKFRDAVANKARNTRRMIW